jgi:hypothetical protein
MNTQLNIKARRSFFSPSFVTLLMGVFVVLVLGGSSIQAQTTTTTDTAAPVDSSLTIAAKGSFSDPTAGTITVNGNVIISARKVVDNTSTTTPAIVMIDFDFSQLKGTSGSTKSTLKTYVTGDTQASEIRPLQASDTIIVTVPYYESTKDVLSARTMLVNATLKFDTTTGKLAAASISVGNNVVTSAAVGTTTTTTTIQ